MFLAPALNKTYFTYSRSMDEKCRCLVIPHSQAWSVLCKAILPWNGHIRSYTIRMSKVPVSQKSSEFASKPLWKPFKITICIQVLAEIRSAWDSPTFKNALIRSGGVSSVAFSRYHNLRVEWRHMFAPRRTFGKVCQRESERRRTHLSMWSGVTGCHASPIS